MLKVGQHGTTTLRVWCTTVWAKQIAWQSSSCWTMLNLRGWFSRSAFSLMGWKCGNVWKLLQSWRREWEWWIYPWIPLRPLRQILFWSFLVMAKRRSRYSSENHRRLSIHLYFTGKCLRSFHWAYGGFLKWWIPKSHQITTCVNMFQYVSMVIHDLDLGYLGYPHDLGNLHIEAIEAINQRRFHRDPRSLSFQVFLKHPIRPGSRKQWWPASLACWWSLLVTWCRIGCCYIPLRAVIIW